MFLQTHHSPFIQLLRACLPDRPTCKVRNGDIFVSVSYLSPPVATRLVAARVLRPLLGKQAQLHPPPASSSPVRYSIRLYGHTLGFRPFSSSLPAPLTGGVPNPPTSRFLPARHRQPPRSRLSCSALLGLLIPVMEMLNCKGVRFSFIGINCTRTNQLMKVGSLYRAMTITCCEYSPDPARKRHERYQQQPQNVDLPELQPKNKKKPFPVPIKKMLQASRQNKRLAQMRIEKPLEPPKNGLLLPELVPVAYEVLDNWKVLIRGLSELLNVVTVYGCRKCPQVHVGPVGHEIQDCYGSGSQRRNSHHSWVRGSINDVLIPIESYHLFDPFGRRVKHDTRFEFDRIPAIVELCIQAGVELPQYPSRRRTAPVRMIGKKVIDRGGVVEEPKPHRSEDCVSLLAELDTFSNQQGQSPAPSNVKEHAEMTLKAYCNVRQGVRKLMRKYMVKACGYCSEVHVGPWGHNVKLCGAFKHQWRDGKHGWQDAVVDEVIPPNYVWHVPDPAGPPLRSSLRSFYGKAPAVVELCVQAGAEIPEEYRPMMRTDIVIPDSKEARLAA